MAIADDLVGHAHVSYLGDPFEQYCGLNGKPLIGGWIEVYQAGTDTKYITMQNFDGAMNPFKVPLNADGRVVMLADPSLTYDIYVRNSYGDLVCSRLNVECTCPGNISIKGLDTWVRNTDGTLNVSLQTSANNRRVFTVNTHSKLLDVQSPLYFVENSTSATIIGIKGGASGYVTKDYVDSVVSSKLDTTAFSAVSGDFLTDKFEYDDNFNITGYDGSAFASNGQTYSAGTNIDITDNVISVTGLPTSSDVENAISSAVTNVENKFEYNENNYITAYNSSAFAGTNYSAGDYVSIENDTISVTGLQPSGDYATHDDLTAYQPSGDYATKTELESATSCKMDVTGMTAYQPTGDYATHDDLTAYQPVGDYYSASNPSGFITNDAITGLQPSGDYYSASNPSGFITNDAITGLQPSGDYVTHDEMTAYQPTGDYATHDDLTGYATTSLVSSVSSELYSAISGISGDYELVAGEGVELVDDPNAKTTTINVTAEGTPVTAIEQMIESATSGLQPSGDYATTADLTAKQDTLDYGYHDTAISSIDSTALYDTSAHARINTLAGRISNLSSDKLDASAFSEVSGDFYTTANPSGFISEVPDTYLQNTDLATTDGKVTAISGIPLSAGGSEIPTAVSGYWQSASDTVCANSAAWGGSALLISAGTGVKVELVDDTLVFSNDETVLWEGDATPTGTVTGTYSEPISNFERVRMYWRNNDAGSFKCAEYFNTNSLVYMGDVNPNLQWWKGIRVLTDTTGFTNVHCWEMTLGSPTNAIEVNTYHFLKLVGINRIAGGN